MTSLFAFFGALAVSLPSRILASLGIGFISMAAYGTAVTSLINVAKTNWSGLGGVSLQIASLAGAHIGFGIILGAVVVRVSLASLSRLGKIA